MPIKIRKTLLIVTLTDPRPDDISPLITQNDPITLVDVITLNFDPSTVPINDLSVFTYMRTSDLSVLRFSLSKVSSWLPLSLNFFSVVGNILIIWLELCCEHSFLKCNFRNLIKVKSTDLKTSTYSILIVSRHSLVESRGSK